MNTTHKLFEPKGWNLVCFILMALATDTTNFVNILAAVFFLDSRSSQVQTRDISQTPSASTVNESFPLHHIEKGGKRKSGKKSNTFIGTQKNTWETKQRAMKTEPLKIDCSLLSVGVVYKIQSHFTSSRSRRFRNCTLVIVIVCTCQSESYESFFWWKVLYKRVFLVRSKICKESVQRVLEIPGWRHEPAWKGR